MLSLVLLALGLCCFFPVLLCNLIYWKSPNSHARLVAKISMGCFCFELVACAIILAYITWLVRTVGASAGSATV